MTDNQHQHWSQFWQQGHITTFGPSLPDNYGGLLRDFWLTSFTRLPKHARILDLATGNGALATLAATASNDSDLGFTIHGTDIATIRPSVANEAFSEARSQITFTSHTPCDKQPFPDSSFDFICSQFGCEYSDLPATLVEVHRLLATDARFAAIAHHEESSLIQDSRQELGVYYAAFRQFDIFGRLREFFAALGDTPPNTDLTQAMAAARPLAEQLNDALNQFKEHHGSSPCGQQMLGAISHLAKGASRASGQQRMAAVQAAQTDFTLAEQRLADMTNAALDADDIAALRELANSAGFNAVEIREYRVEGDSLTGWLIELG